MEVRGTRELGMTENPDPPGLGLREEKRKLFWHDHQINKSKVRFSL
jgi:hypothetical protein